MSGDLLPFTTRGTTHVPGLASVAAVVYVCRLSVGG